MRSSNGAAEVEDIHGFGVYIGKKSYIAVTAECRASLIYFRCSL